VWTKIKKIIPQKALKLGIDKEVKFFNIKSEWDGIIIEALGIKFKKKSETVNLKNGVLYVRCRNAIWANEFQIKKDKILAIIQKNKVPVKQIKFIF